MSAFQKINLVSIALCLCVIVFGAYVRLADAGLGCPDWPGCYGHLGVPDEAHEVSAAEEKFPERPVEAPKAWKEMIHRYLASTLGLLIVVMAVLSLKKTGAGTRVPKVLPWALVGLVIFQGILGMWTVTWQLKPFVVTAHLFGGLATLSLLVWVLLRTRSLERASGSKASNDVRTNLKGLAMGALFVLLIQIFLGGWTSTNYAALACPDFPTCHGQWIPETDVGEAFTLWRGLGVNYEFGVLNNRARVTIHYFHRIGAVITSLVLISLALVLLQKIGTGVWRKFAYAILGFFSLQVAIGISTVIFQLPLLLAAAHNAGAALLVVTLVSLNYFVWNPES